MHVRCSPAGAGHELFVVLETSGIRKRLRLSAGRSRHQAGRSRLYSQTSSEPAMAQGTSHTANLATKHCPTLHHTARNKQKSASQPQDNAAAVTFHSVGPLLQGRPCFGSVVSALAALWSLLLMILLSWLREEPKQKPIASTTLSRCQSSARRTQEDRAVEQINAYMLSNGNGNVNIATRTMPEAS